MKLLEYKYSSDGENHEIYFRNAPSSDLPVINQIFQQQVYSLDGWSHKELLEKYYIDNFQGKKRLIIDAGANIGASSIYFSDNWKNSFTISIEPEKYNYSLLKLNTLGKSILPLEGAISSENGTMYLFDPGHGDVGFRVKNSGGDYQVSAYSAKQLIEIGEKNNAAPFICKIDIEGGEKSLFDSNVEWLDKFPLIIIELHDWMLPGEGTSRAFQKAIAERNFDILQKGENLFYFNMDILS